ncbi:putative cytochrome p450 protein [Neofusicoccum parvum]|uniref:Cytochrome p450 protein n=1 Tax=Neofusicoccum parvum TaxID=310453 RepID=A0ACB5SH33_9PEZI|nr:putative cytochrome p450 protein [Neofusicoccum parvum]
MLPQTAAIVSLQDASPAKWAVLAATITLAALLSTCAYRVFLHPLHRYPGPTLHAISSLPRAIATILGREAELMLALHKRHGPVVRVGPNELSYVDPRAIKDIYGHRRAGGGLEFARDAAFFDPALNGAADILRAADGAAHARLRKALSHSFSDRALRNQAPLLKTHVAKLLANLGAARGAPVDLSAWFNATTFDVMADLTFSAPLGLLDGNTRWEDWVHAITAQPRGMTVARVLRGYAAVWWFLSLFVPRSMAAARRKVWDYAVTRVDARLAAGSDKPDLWAEMMARNEGMPVEEMHANAEVFMVAGTETTATMLSGLTWYLVTNLDKFEKLKREVREATPREEDVTVERLQGLKYLHACVEEGFRMYPPAAIGPPRVTPAEGAKICDGWVAGGQWASYRYPPNFTRPDEYIPERWLENKTGEFANDKKEILQPFSYGPRNCIGKK